MTCSFTSGSNPLPGHYKRSRGRILPGLAASAPVSRAFVLGAGLGTRLGQLTEARPKPLVPLAGRPLIARAFDHLIGAGVRAIAINTHHRAEAYAAAFPEGSYRGIPLAFRHEPELLDTGGGIKNVEDLFGDSPFLVYNGDVFATLPLEPAIAHHLASGNEVTLILRSSGEALHIAFEETGRGGGFPVGRIADIRERLGRAPGTHLFTGIYLVSPAFFRRLAPGKASVVSTFLEMIAEQPDAKGTPGPLGGIVIDEGEWWDLGTREQLLAAHRRLREAAPDACWVHPQARVAPDAWITGASHIGARAEVGPNVRLHDTILWEDAKAAPGSELTRCIVTEGRSAAGRHTDTDF